MFVRFVELIANNDGASNIKPKNHSNSFHTKVVGTINNGNKLTKPMDSSFFLNLVLCFFFQTHNTHFQNK